MTEPVMRLCAFQRSFDEVDKWSTAER